MPAALDACVESLLKKWKSDPKSRPTPRKDKDGKPQDAKSQAHAICTSSLQKAGKMTDLSDPITLEGVGPVIMGGAVTNRPHLKGLPTISVQENGELRVPLLILGKWRHPRGMLNFTKEYVGRMLENFQNNVLGMDISLDHRHKPEFGAVGWFKHFAFEEGVRHNLFVGYADPTPPGKKLIEDKQYRYASIEFHPNYSNPLVAALSADELQSFNSYIVEEAIQMPDNEEIITDEEVVTIDENRILALESALAESGSHQQQLVQLLSDAQERIEQLEAVGKERFVETIMLRATSYRDDEKRAHPKVLLDWAAAILLDEDIGEGEGIITLSDDADAGATKSYYRRAIAWLLENLPGAVPMENPDGEIDRDVSRSVRLEGDTEEYDDDDVREIKNAWSY